VRQNPSVAARPTRLRRRGNDLTADLLAILDGQEVGVIVRDVEGRMIEANATAEALLGLTFDEVAGSRAMAPLWRCVTLTGEPIADDDLPIAVTLRTGEPITDAVIGLHRPDSSLVWLRVSSHLVSVGAAATFIDVTPERELSAEADAGRRTLEGVLQAVSGFANRYEVRPDGTHTAVITGVAAASAVLGATLPADADLARLWDSRVHPDDRAAHGEHRRRLLRGEDAELEYRIVGFDGVERWVWTRDRPRRTEDGRLLVDGVTFDITERRRRAVELDAARERLATVLGTINEVVFELTVQPDGAMALAYAGPGLDHIVGQRVDEGENVAALLRALVHPDDRDRYLDHLARLMRGEPSDCECRLVGDDAPDRSIWLRARPRRDDDGALRIAVVIADVTELETARARVDLLNDRLGAVIDAIDDVIWESEIDDDGVETFGYLAGGVTEVIGAALNTADHDEAAVIWESLIHPDDRAMFGEHRRRVAAEHDSDCTYRLVGLDGQTRLIWSRARPRRRASGGLHVFGIATDVTARGTRSDQAP
jgi:PAS domain-containing protein